MLHNDNTEICNAHSVCTVYILSASPKIILFMGNLRKLSVKQESRALARRTRNAAI